MNDERQPARSWKTNSQLDPQPSGLQPLPSRLFRKVAGPLLCSGAPVGRAALLRVEAGFSVAPMIEIR
jgi:hypothetical protein